MRPSFVENQLAPNALQVAQQLPQQHQYYTASNGSEPVVIAVLVQQRFNEASSRKCTQGHQEQKFESFFGRKIAIDASMSIYQFLVLRKMESEHETQREKKKKNQLFFLRPAASLTLLDQNRDHRWFASIRRRVILMLLWQLLSHLQCMRRRLILYKARAHCGRPNNVWENPISQIASGSIRRHGNWMKHRHRRTGRAGQEGCAITFISEKDARYAPDLVKALELSEQVVPDDLRALADSFMELAHGTGYGGSGFKFNEEEDEVRIAAKKAQAREHGFEEDKSDSEDEDEAVRSEGSGSSGE
ncbi:hypothetical protein SLEP1_g40390 [Rubroshorea leprosula]|uniref:XPG N-terminal domain-containing protein n=1 Tax=Rubroshorea leprosula TaxID=152421 RepID=A0AAV5L437_9ROSI|nr:hypothetical protein SLEP1_g40390 [Rubroshorea leprosula]